MDSSDEEDGTVEEQEAKRKMRKSHEEPCDHHITKGRDRDYTICGRDYD